MNYYCHDCKSRQRTTPESGVPVPTARHFCMECGAAILCDECGGEWSHSHDCATCPGSGCWPLRFEPRNGKYAGMCPVCARYVGISTGKVDPHPKVAA